MKQQFIWYGCSCGTTPFVVLLLLLVLLVAAVVLVVVGNVAAVGVAVGYALVCSHSTLYLFMLAWYRLEFSITIEFCFSFVHYLLFSFARCFVIDLKLCISNIPHIYHMHFVCILYRGWIAFVCWAMFHIPFGPLRSLAEEQQQQQKRSISRLCFLFSCFVYVCVLFALACTS